MECVLRQVLRGKKVVAGSPGPSFPQPALIAISQHVATLTSLWFAGASMTVPLRSGAEVGIVPDEPEKRVRVQEQGHSMYSLKSSSGASKSGAIQWMVPLALPALHGHELRGSARTNFATGSPFSAITTSSPGANRCIRSESWVCASCIVTVGIALSSRGIRIASFLTTGSHACRATASRHVLLKEFDELAMNHAVNRLGHDATL